MLILQRRPGDIVTINNNIDIVLLTVTGQKATIGICAPKDIAVIRRELCGKPAQQHASTSPPKIRYKGRLTVSQ